MYKGITSGGINRGVASILENASFNRDNLGKSSSIQEACVMFEARAQLSKHRLMKKDKEEIQNQHQDRVLKHSNDGNSSQNTEEKK